MRTLRDVSAEHIRLVEEYRELMPKITEHVLMELALSFKIEWPQSRWLHMGTTDQDYSGGQVPIGLYDAEGNEVVPEDEISDLAWECGIIDLDNRAEEVWGLFVKEDVAGIARNSDERFLDLDLIVTTYDLDLTTYPEVSDAGS